MKTASGSLTAPERERYDMKWAILLAMAILSSLVAPPAHAGRIPTYKVVDLGTGFQARGINDAGVVYGSLDGFPATVSLPKRGSPKVKKYDVRLGEVRGVCTSTPSTIIGFVEVNGQMHAATFGNTTKLLPFPAPSQALGINNKANMVVGWATKTLSGGGTRRRPVALSKSVVSWPDFTYGGTTGFFENGEATFVNDKGIIAGQAEVHTFPSMALTWRDGSARYPTWNVLGRITSLGKTVTTYEVDPSDPYEDLNIQLNKASTKHPATGVRPGWTYLAPIGVAERSGWVAGNGTREDGTSGTFLLPFKKPNGAVTELSTRVTTPGWTISSIVGMNQKGEIVGYATDLTGTEHTIVLRPR